MPQKKMSEKQATALHERIGAAAAHIQNAMDEFANTEPQPLDPTFQELHRAVKALHEAVQLLAELVF